MSLGSLNDRVRHMDWDQLNRYADGLDDDAHESAEAFRVKLEHMSDADLAAVWGIRSPGLASSIRDLFATPWR